MSDLRQLKGIVTGAARNATFENREYIVLPVIALVEGVLHASNAATPELVLAEEFTPNFQSWNGRPLVYDHPLVGGQHVSANSPDVLEKYKIGQVFNATVTDKKLAMEAWIDREAAGRIAPGILEFAAEKNSRPMEVSVGVFVVSEPLTGVYAESGKQYQAVWRQITADHLAVLKEGVKGACNVEMGCGLGRVAQSTKAKEEKTMTIRQKFLELLGKQTNGKELKDAADAVGDSELRGMLDRALFATEPGYLGIIEVFQETTEVIYATAPDGEEHYYRRGYTVAEDQAITFAKDSVEVKPKMTYEAASAAIAAVRAAAEKGRVDMEKKARIKVLIETGKTCFKAGDEAVLEQLSEERLTAMEEHVKQLTATTTTTAPPPPPPLPAPETPEVRRAKFLAENPDVAEVLIAHKAAAEAKKNELVTKLKTAQAVYSEDELKAMDVKSLSKLAQVLIKDAIDFSGSGSVPHVPANEGPRSSEELRAAMQTKMKQVAEAK